MASGALPGRGGRWRKKRSDRMNKDLKQLFAEDQQDCQHQPPDGTEAYKALRGRTRERIHQARSIIEGGTPDQFTGEDYYHACILLLHGNCAEDFHQAYQFGIAGIDRGYNAARRFAASAYDKWMMYQGKPQKFGLQYVPDGVRLRVWDVDPATTDAERKEWDVPSLERLHQIAAEATGSYDMSTINMEDKPQWLKDAIKRWRTAGE